MDKISIITVTHDAYDFVRLCIKAVRARTNIPYEHIIIDNGSAQKTITFLRIEAKKQHITLYERRIPKKSSGHALSLDWLLYNEGLKTNFVCLLDSDAYPIKSGWLNELYQLMLDTKSDAIGFEHFRNHKLLHPSCMLFKYHKLLQTNKTSFKIRKTSTIFNDTGMLVCQKMVQNGVILHPLPKQWMEDNICRHRWCATRAEIARDGKLDGHMPLSQFDNESKEWFNYLTVLLIIHID